MYKVMIMQENINFCRTLKQMIDWQALECEVVSMTTSMSEAVSEYRKLKPEIVITDIVLNGDELTPMLLDLHQTQEEIQVIIVSAQDGYRYVRNALKAGVFDYLLRTELKQCMFSKTIKEAILHLKNYRSKSLREAGSSIERLRQYMVLYRNQHEVNAEDVKESLKGHAFEKYRHAGYQLAFFRIDNIRLLYESKITCHKQLKERLQSVIVNVLPEDQSYLILFISNHSGVILFKGMQHLRTMNYCNLMIQEVQDQMNIEMSVTISKTCEDLHEFFSLYQYLLERHEARFYIGGKVIVEDEEIPVFKDLDPMATNYHLGFMQAMRNRDFSLAEEVVDEILIYMKKEFIHPKQVRNYFVFLFSNVEGEEMQKGLQNVFHLEAWLDLISNAETMEMLKQVVKNTIGYIRSWIKDTNNNRYRDDITKIIEYIEENYTMKLSLKDIAESFSINESYLSRMFKNETGKNLIYFINEKKMSKALELLENPNMTIKKVANLVGMNDQFYFNKVFKKFYHVSPSEYRKHQKQEL